MLPKTLISSYRQYKEDIIAITTWLVRVAETYGYPISLLQRNPSSNAMQPNMNRSQRRRQAKAYAKLNIPASEHTQPNPLPKPDYLLEKQELLTLARFIAASESSGQLVTVNLVTALERVVKAKRHHVNYPQDNDSKERLANESHLHFLGILDDVRTTLMSMPYRANGDLGPLPESGKPLANSFDAFAAEDTKTIDEESKVASAAPTLDASNQKVLYGVKEEEFEDTLKAMLCLFEDLSQLRDTVYTGWNRYLLGKLGLSAVTIITNVAIDFAGKLEHDFLTFFKAFADPEEIVETCFIALGGGASPNGRQTPEDYLDRGFYDEACYVLLPALLLLIGGKSGFSWNSFPVYKPGFLGTLDLSSDREPKTVREKFAEDKISFAMSFPDFFSVCRCSSAPFKGEDEVTRAFRPYIRTQKITISLMFAFQVWLDIRNILRTQCYRPLQELIRTADYIKTSINNNKEFQHGLTSSNWSKRDDEAQEKIITMINEWVETDPFFSYKEKQVRKVSGTPRLTASNQFDFYKQNPLFCGSLTFILKMLFNEYAVMFANAWASIISTAHLYNAVRSTRIGGVFWGDLEYIIFKNGAEHIFSGERPSTIEEFPNKFALAMGGLESNLADKQAVCQALTAKSKLSHRLLKPLAPVSSIFRAKYCSPAGTRFDLSVEEVQNIVDQILGYEVLQQFVLSPIAAASHGSVAVTQPHLTTAPEPSKIYTGPFKEEDKRVWKETHKRWPPHVLLNPLLSAIEFEDESVVFDYLALHRSCWSALQRIQEHLHDNFIQELGSGYLQEQQDLPFLIGQIFKLALQKKKSATATLPDKPVNETTSKIFLETSAIIADMLSPPHSPTVVLERLGRLLSDKGGARRGR